MKFRPPVTDKKKRIPVRVSSHIIRMFRLVRTVTTTAATATALGPVVASAAATFVEAASTTTT